MELIAEYKSKIEEELHSLCNELVDLVDSKLIDRTEDEEVKVFYLKMKGDYYRYSSEAGNTDAPNKSLEAYDAALNAAANLPANNPVKLGLALNFSVFYYEVLKDPTKACELAKATFDEALPNLEELK